MTLRNTPITALVQKLAEGWRGGQAESAEELVSRWKDKFNTAINLPRVTGDALHFSCDLSDIRLRGMDEVNCLLLSGSGPSVEDAIESFLNTARAPGRMTFVLTFTPAALELARNAFAGNACLVLSPDQIQALFEAADPRPFLKHWLRKQVPRRRLMPYNILQPAGGHMFFGRKRELDQLRYEPEVSFAVAGPSRIGKTSLVKQYHRLVKSKTDPAKLHCFYVDFYECADRSADSIAQFLALKIEPSSRSAHLKAGDLVGFLRHQRSRYQRPLDLLLDELDEIWHSETLRLLGASAKQGLCRLILCGRGVVLKAALGPNAPLECRLQLMLLDPLDDEAGRKLLLEPLDDLGFRIDDPDQLTATVFRLTGKLPHLLQFYGRKLVGLALAENTNIITPQHVETLRWDFETAQYFTSPLADLTDPKSRLLALSILMRDGHTAIDPQFVGTIAAEEGIELTHGQSLAYCHDLFINNVLAWKQGRFCVANEALSDYARQMGFLDEALKEARLQVGALATRR